MQLRSRGQQLAAAGAVIALAAGLAACSSNSNPPASGGSGGSGGGSSSLSGTINASGSTFQTNFQQSAIAMFKQTNSGVTVNYGGGGSGKGRTDLFANTVQFAGSDSPIPDKDKSKVPAGKTVLYFPVQIGPIAIAYNLQGVSSLKLDATTLAKIFSGTIKTWNDPAIKALNSGATLPSTPIKPVVRSDSSGTSQNFGKYLEKAAPSVWKGGSTSTFTAPPGATAAQGGPGVAQAVKQTAGAIGYVDDSTAKASSLSAASVKNKAGAFVAPSTDGATAAASNVTPDADLTFSTVDEPGATSYPITYQSWDLLYAKQPNANDAKLLKAYLGFLLGSQGQSLLPTLGLAKLPNNIDQMAIAQLSKITS